MCFEGFPPQVIRLPGGGVRRKTAACRKTPRPLDAKICRVFKKSAERVPPGATARAVNREPSR